MRFEAFTFVSASLVALTSAFTTPVGNVPSGNPIYKPNLGDIVPKGEPYTITWGPTSSGTITLVLLRGPSENVVPLKVIAERIPNSGSYVWTPDSSLEPDSSRYGIQLIQDSDGAYQYSTQFGIGAGTTTGSSSSSLYPSSSSSSSSSSSQISISAEAYLSTSAPVTTTTSSTPAGETIPLPTTTFFKHYNGSCHVCPPHNQTTTVSSSTLVSPGTTRSANTTTYPTGASSTNAIATSRATSPASPSTPSNGTAPASPSLPMNTAGQLALPLGSAVFGLAGLFVAMMI